MKFHRLYTLIENVFQPASRSDIRDRKQDYLKEVGMAQVIIDVARDVTAYFDLDEITVNQDKRTILIVPWWPYAGGVGAIKSIETQHFINDVNRYVKEFPEELYRQYKIKSKPLEISTKKMIFSYELPVNENVFQPITPEEKSMRYMDYLDQTLNDPVTGINATMRRQVAHGDMFNAIFDKDKEEIIFTFPKNIEETTSLTIDSTMHWFEYNILLYFYDINSEPIDVERGRVILKISEK